MNPAPHTSHPQDDKTSPTFEGAARGTEGQPLPDPPKSAARLGSSGDVGHPPSKAGTEAIPENVAGMLCYLFGWVGGLVFLLIDRRPFVRFHAAQSIAVFATLSILLLALSGFFVGAILPMRGTAAVLLVLRRLLELTWLVATVVLVLKAAGGEWFRVGRIASHYGDEAAHGMR